VGVIQNLNFKREVKKVIIMDFKFAEKVAMENQPKFMETVGIIDKIVAEYKRGNVVDVEPIKCYEEFGDEIAGYRLHSQWFPGTPITAIDFCELNDWFLDEDAFEIEGWGHHGVFTDLVLAVIEFLDEVVEKVINYETTDTTVTIEGVSSFGENFRFFYDLSDYSTWGYED
jgi:hypothetical protein